MWNRIAIAGFCGICLALIIAAIALWKPVSARLAFDQLWNRGAYMSLLNSAGEDKYRGKCYLRFLDQKIAASKNTRERLEAAKLRALISGETTPPQIAFERFMAAEARRLLAGLGFESAAGASVDLDLDCVTEHIIRNGREEIRRKEAIPHNASMTFVIFYREGQAIDEATIARLKAKLGRELGIKPERITGCAMQSRKED